MVASCTLDCYPWYCMQEQDIHITRTSVVTQYLLTNDSDAVRLASPAEMAPADGHVRPDCIHTEISAHTNPGSSILKYRTTSSDINHNRGET